MKNVTIKRHPRKLTRETVENASDLLSDWFEGGPLTSDTLTIISVKGNYLSSKDDDGTLMVEFLTNNEYEGIKIIENAIKHLY